MDVTVFPCEVGPKSCNFGNVFDKFSEELAGSYKAAQFQYIGGLGPVFDGLSPILT